MISSFWHGTTLSPLARACLGSFVSHGHSVTLFTYDPVETPPGVVRADARDVVDTRDPLHDLLDVGDVAMFADYFRYRMLQQRGGWWVDSDVFCLTDHLPEVSYAWAEQQPGVINNAILKLPPGDPIADQLVTLARQRAAHGALWGELGPHLATEVLTPLHPPNRACTRRAFYPIHWIEAHYLWMPQFAPVVAQRIEGGTFLHCWSATLDSMGIDLTLRPPSSSAFERLMPATALQPLTLWQRLRIRRSIRRFLNQRWVHRHWTREVEREWREFLLGTPVETEVLVDA